MTHPKEECFKNAWNKYKDTFEDPMEVKQETWGQRTDGTWDSNYGHFWHAINSFLKQLRGQGGTTTQVRAPDLTINQGGRRSVLDLKFTRADGTVDDWNPNRVGAGSRNTQRRDYTDINKQLNDGKDPYGGDPKLDPQKCGCDQPNGTQTAPIKVFYNEYSESFSLEDVDPIRPRLGPIRLPRPAPSPVPGRIPGGVRLPPIRVPFP